MVIPVVAAILIGSVALLTLWLWRVRPDAPVTSSDADWQLLLAKRSELDADATLSETLKESLRKEWAQNADAILSRSSSPSASAPSQHRHAAGIAGAVVIAAVALYAVTGRWDDQALTWPWGEAAGPHAGFEPPAQPGAAHPGSNETLAERIVRLEAKLKQSPDDLDGWVLLARSRRNLREFPQAADALERALALSPGHPDLLSELADMLAMTAGKSLAGRPSRLVDEALKASPVHPKALSLAATAAMQRGDSAAAAGFWQRLRATFPADSPEAAQIDAVLASLPGGGKSQASPAPAAGRVAIGGATVGAAAGAVQGKVRLAPAFVDRFKAGGFPSGAMLFVVARVPGGPPMPVAVLRMPADTLAQGGEVTFRLGDEQAMAATQKLSALGKVDLEARVSLTGVAGKQRGDPIGVARGVAVGSAGLQILLTAVHE